MPNANREPAMLQEILNSVSFRPATAENPHCPAFYCTHALSPDASLFSFAAFSASWIALRSSFEALYVAVTWLKGLSGCFSNSFRISAIFWFLRRPFSSFISSSLRSSYCAYAALNRRSGCLSSLSFWSAVRSRASRALSIPVALRALGFVSNDAKAESMPRDFFSALGALPLGFEGSDASSSARRAAFSAFLRSASAAFAAAASLQRSQFSVLSELVACAYAFEFDFAPLFHSAASAASCSLFFAACLEAAASALRAWPCAFLDPSPPPAAAPPFFAMFVQGASVCRR
jgi:hypothetical protein